MDKYFLVKAQLLFKLAKKRKWGNSHTAFDNLKKGFKPKDYSLVKRVALDLIKENMLFRKPTGYGLQVSLNQEKAQEIKQIIFELLSVKVD